MKPTLLRCCIFGLLVTTATVSRAQDISGRVIKDSLPVQSGDTLIINDNLKIYLNQQLVVGNATGGNGWYATIGFKSAFNWPSWLFKNAEEQLNYDYQADPQRRVNDKVKAMLAPGDSVTITKIKRRGNKKTGYWYTADLKSKKAFSPRYRCNLVYALRTKELSAWPN